MRIPPPDTTHTLLLVDDESHVLAALRRTLRRGNYEILMATSGPAGLEILEEREVALVLSDHRMPRMTGVEFLNQVKERQPDAMRIMLTGYADIQAVMDAINKGEVYRFITKPWDDQALRITIRQALEQYDLVMENRRLAAAERELLEKTVSGSVKVLTEILSLANPVAFSRATRIRRYVRHITAQLQLSDAWQFELAAMLSQIGCVTLPSDTLEKIYVQKPLSEDEQKMFSSHPSVGGKLLVNIPRLEAIAHMIEGQQQPFITYPPSQSSIENLTPEGVIALGAQILKVVLDLDQLMVRGLSHDEALLKLRERKGEYNPRVVAALESLPGEFYEPAAPKKPPKTTSPTRREPLDERASQVQPPPEPRQIDEIGRSVRVRELSIGMVINEDVWTKDGALLVAKGQEVTYPVLQRLHNFARGMGVVEPIRVFVPRLEHPQETAEEDEDV